MKYTTSKIAINTPSQFDFFSSVAPNFDISTFDPNINSTWYTLDGGTVNVSFSGLSGSINQTEWAKQGNGMVLIRFYANNTMGREDYVELSVIKNFNRRI